MVSDYGSIYGLFYKSTPFKDFHTSVPLKKWATVTFLTFGNFGHFYG